MTFQIEFVGGEGHRKRSVCFLISDDKKVTAKPVFDVFREKNKSVERSLRSRFDAWIGNQPPKPARYHGWSKTEFSGKYTKCFVFKAKNNRFYGFLCNPKSSDPGYQVCILVRHAKKNEHETDETELKKVEELRMTLAVQKAINKTF